MHDPTELSATLAANAFKGGQWDDAIRQYAGLILANPDRAIIYRGTLEQAKFKRLQERAKLLAGQPIRVGVGSYELAHNPAGRALTLAELYEPHAEVEIFGSLFPSWGTELWAPMRGHRIPVHSFVVRERKATLSSNFVGQAFELVLHHPYDIVHLSKPRGPNLIFALLYKWVWGSKVIFDVDDEELGFVKPPPETSGDSFEQAEAVAIETYVAANECLPTFVGLARGIWTQLAVASVSLFDEITVSNPALQSCYGGSVVPHVRNFDSGAMNERVKRSVRREFGIPETARVVLFFGTPRRHKGLVETAYALSQLDEPNVHLVVVGSFPDDALYQELQTACTVPLTCIPNQPYSRISELVCLGDYSVILQDINSRVARYQSPAKLTDALAAGTVVFASETPALKPFFEAAALVPVTVANLVDTLSAYLSETQGRLLTHEASQRAVAFYNSYLKSSNYDSLVKSLCKAEVPRIPSYEMSQPLEHLLQHTLDAVE